jgi:ABC-type methionine transport system ATPase subunit
MVYQYSALLSSRNVRENVGLPLEELTTKSRDEIDKIVDQKLEMVGMKDSRNCNALRVERWNEKAREPRARARDEAGADSF